MSTKPAAALCTEAMVTAIEVLGKQLKAYFRTLSDNHRETFLLISRAMFFGASNIDHVPQGLGLPKTTRYHRVRNVRVSSWRQLLPYRLDAAALPRFLNRLTQSEATKSRDGLILAVDDTVMARIAPEFGSVWTWGRGQLQRVTEGQKVIAFVLVMGDLILPRAVRIVSTQGQGLKTPPEIDEERLVTAQARLAAAGIDIGALTTTGDAA